MPSPRQAGPRVRFAPSPTGYLHLGGARTALFNWLFARRHGGVFILRIEDTDLERSRPEYVREIIDSMTWLGLCHDEGPHFQSRRGELYAQAARRLVDSGHAYPCFCSPQELEARREAAAARGEAFRYDGRCAGLSQAEADRMRAGGISPAVRVRVPAGTSGWEDLVRGPISFDNRELDDFVIVKGDGTPTYQFAVVVDDVDMGITRVIRGEDHISNTPKQLVLYEALGEKPPAFAHIPLIHGTDGKRLSKRHGATAVTDYRAMGFVPEALVNYLALLGWSPGGDREVMSLQEMVSLFDLGRVVRTPAVFDPEKLKWMNGLYLAAMPAQRRTDLFIPVWTEAGLLTPGDADERRGWLEEVAAVVGDRVKVLPDVVPYTAFLFREEVEPDAKAAAVLARAAADREVFAELAGRLEGLAEFTRGPIEEAFRGLMAERGLGAGKLIQPVRAAVAGTTVTPGLFESLELLGRERALKRIRGSLLRRD